MKISSISNNTSFGRAIKIQNSKNCTHNANQELEQVLNGQRSNIYSPKESRQLRMFFREILGDYNSENNSILLRNTEDGDTILISGKEATDIQSFEQQKQDARKRIWKNKKLSVTKKRGLVKKTHNDEREEVKSIIENGKNGKPATKLLITSDKDSGKISHIDYESMQIEYTMFQNGHVMTKEEFEKSDKLTRCLRSVSYETKTFDLKG